MSNIAVFNPGQLPAFAKKGELSATAKALAGSAGASGKRISIKGGVFRLIDNGKEVAAVEERYLDVVIVHAAPKVGRTFYAGTYDENKTAAPDCWSADGDKPDASIKTPQFYNCANCPKNAKGSGQGDAKACRYSQKLAVLLANDIEGDVMQLQLAATSLFGDAEGENRPLNAHAKWLTAQGIDPTMLVTRLKFDTKAPVPKLFFKPMRWLTDDEYAVTKAKGESEDAIKAITMSVFAQDGGSTVAAPAAFEGTPPKAATKAAPAPQADGEDDEPPAPAPVVKAKAKAAPAPLPPETEEDEPVVKPAKVAAAKTAAPAATGLAATLAAWDDE
jgi:hypothetical protein